MVTLKKTAAPKKVAKKTTRTTGGTHASERRVLVCAEGSTCFWAHDGSIWSNLVELRHALDTMSLDVFRHHVRDEKNDFAEWVEHVLEDRDLAEILRTKKTPASVRTAIVARLKMYDV